MLCHVTATSPPPVEWPMWTAFLRFSFDDGKGIGGIVVHVVTFRHLG